MKSSGDLINNNLPKNSYTHLNQAIISSIHVKSPRIELSNTFKQKFENFYKNFSILSVI